MTPRSSSRSSFRRTPLKSGHRDRAALRANTHRRLGARKPMDKMTVRDARHDEAAFIVQMIRHMVADMASYGGNTPATDDAAWERIAVAIAGELKGNNVKYLVAEIGRWRADWSCRRRADHLCRRVFTKEDTAHQCRLRPPAVAPRRQRQPLDRKAVGLGARRRLRGCCDLNVLSGNPARSLYERCGFSVSEVKMVRAPL